MKKHFCFWLVICLTAVFFTCNPLNAQTKKPYKVGAVFAQTGGAAFLGEFITTSLKLMTEQTNKQGGINGHPVKLIMYDNESQATKTVLAAKRLIEQDKVHVITGTIMSGNALAVFPLCEKAKIPFIANAGSKRIVMPVEKRPYAFKAHCTDIEIIATLIKFFHLRGISKIAMLSDSTGFGTSARDELKIQAPQKGINVVAWEEFASSAKDLTPQLTKIRAADPEAIICWTVTPACVVFLKNLKQLGIKSLPVFGWGSVDKRYMKLAGKASEGLVGVQLSFPVAEQLPDDDPIKAVILKYKKDHKKKFGMYPNTYGGEAHDGMLLALEAFRIAKSFEGPKLKTALESIKDLKGVCGYYKSISPSRHYGLTEDDISVFEWSAGNWRLLMPPGYQAK